MSSDNTIQFLNPVVHAMSIVKGKAFVTKLLKQAKAQNTEINEFIYRYLYLVECGIFDEYQKDGMKVSNDNEYIQKRKTRGNLPSLAKIGDCSIKTDTNLGSRGRKNARKTKTISEGQEVADAGIQTPDTK